jgi:hypothetical protein
MEHQLDATITVLLISKVSSTCFGQTFAHLQERKTGFCKDFTEASEPATFIPYSASNNTQKPCPPHQQDITPYVVKISVLRS